MDSLMIDVSELRLKWAVEDVNRAVEKLVTILDERGDEQMLKATANYLDKMGDYITIAEDTRSLAELKEII